jgi:hypothetical protein
MNRRSCKRAPRRRGVSMGLLAACLFTLAPYFAPPARAQAAAEPPASAPQVPDTPLFFAPPARAPGPSAPTYTAPARAAPTPGTSTPGAPGSPAAPSGTPAAAGSAPGSAPGSIPASAAASADEDIRDIRGPKGMFPLWLLLAVIAAVVVLAIGGYLAWRWKNRRRAARVLRPFEIALESLEGIRTLMHPSTVREFSIAISDIVRRYIEDEFKVTATHLTTEEFLRDLLNSSNAALAAHRQLLAHFLQQCDVAKFAGVSLSGPIMESLHESARRFVIETSKPVAEPQAGGIVKSARMQEAHDSLPSA